MLLIMPRDCQSIPTEISTRINIWRRRRRVSWQGVSTDNVVLCTSSSKKDLDMGRRQVTSLTRVYVVISGNQWGGQPRQQGKGATTIISRSSRAWRILSSSGFSKTPRKPCRGTWSVPLLPTFRVPLFAESIPTVFFRFILGKQGTW